MHQEFLHTAREDAAAGSHYGIACYFRFCSYGLESRWDPQVFGHFQFEALADSARGSTYGLEKVKRFIVHQKFDFPIEVNEEMSAALERFPTRESFRAARHERQPGHRAARGGRARGRAGRPAGGEGPGRERSAEDGHSEGHSRRHRRCPPTRQSEGASEGPGKAVVVVFCITRPRRRGRPSLENLHKPLKRTRMVAAKPRSPGLRSRPCHGQCVEDDGSET
jgi:hypothetical protein